MSVAQIKQSTKQKCDLFSDCLWDTRETDYPVAQTELDEVRFEHETV